MRPRRAADALVRGVGSLALAIGLAGGLGACSRDEALLGGNAAARARTEARDHAGAVAAYAGLLVLLPDDTGAAAGLFHARARLAEDNDRVAPGAADQWLRELASVIDDPTATAGLVRRVRRAGCEECAVGLEALAAARAARAAAAP